MGWVSGRLLDAEARDCIQHVHHLHFRALRSVGLFFSFSNPFRGQVRSTMCQCGARAARVQPQSPGAFRDGIAHVPLLRRVGESVNKI